MAQLNSLIRLEPFQGAHKGKFATLLVIHSGALPHCRRDTAMCCDAGCDDGNEWVKKSVPRKPPRPQSSWPGLSRPSTSFGILSAAWMPGPSPRRSGFGRAGGTSPGMTRGKRCATHAPRCQPGSDPTSGGRCRPRSASPADHRSRRSASSSRWRWRGCRCRQSG